MAPEELFHAWAAGYIDGEGCFSIYRVKYSFGCRLSASSADPKSLEELRSVFGGHVFSEEKPNPNARLGYKWRLTRQQDIVSVIELIRPHLRLKGPQADVLLRFCAGDKEEKERCYEELLILNRRGK